MMRGTWLIAVVVLAAGCLIGRCIVAPGADRAGFRWDRSAIEIGIVAVGTEIETIAEWQAPDSEEIELLAVQPGCGCSLVVMRGSDGRIIEAGDRISGRGQALIRIKADAKAGRKDVAVRAAWRLLGDPGVRVDELTLSAEFRAVFAVTPSAILHAEVDGRACIPFAVTWRSLEPRLVDGVPAPCPDERIVVHQLSRDVDHDGLVSVRAVGDILPPRQHDARLLTRLRVSGVHPGLPDVPIQVTYRMLVEKIPEGVLELRRGEDERAKATFRVCLAPEIASASISGIEVEPVSERERVAVEWARQGERAFAVTVSGQFDDQTRQSVGTLTIHSDRDELDGLVQHWVYLAPRVRSVEEKSGHSESRR